MTKNKNAKTSTTLVPSKRLKQKGESAFFGPYLEQAVNEALKTTDPDQVIGALADPNGTVTLYIYDKDKTLVETKIFKAPEVRMLFNPKEIGPFIQWLAPHLRTQFNPQKAAVVTVPVVVLGLALGQFFLQASHQQAAK